jgi:hypothetical protein
VSNNGVRPSRDIDIYRPVSSDDSFPQIIERITKLTEGIVEVDQEEFRLEILAPWSINEALGQKAVSLSHKRKKAVDETIRKSMSPNFFKQSLMRRVRFGFSGNVEGGVDLVLATGSGVRKSERTDAQGAIESLIDERLEWSNIKGNQVCVRLGALTVCGLGTAALDLQNLTNEVCLPDLRLDPGRVDIIES